MNGSRELRGPIPIADTVGSMTYPGLAGHGSTMTADQAAPKTIVKVENNTTGPADSARDVANAHHCDRKSTKMRFQPSQAHADVLFILFR